MPWISLTSYWNYQNQKYLQITRQRLTQLVTNIIWWSITFLLFSADTFHHWNCLKTTAPMTTNERIGASCHFLDPWWLMVGLTSDQGGWTPRAGTRNRNTLSALQLWAGSSLPCLCTVSYLPAFTINSPSVKPPGHYTMQSYIYVALLITIYFSEETVAGNSSLLNLMNV